MVYTGICAYLCKYNGTSTPVMLTHCSLLQDDILTSTLTVKENVYLSASLRLPSEMKQPEKEEKANEVIEELGLSHVANQLVPNLYM